MMDPDNNFPALSRAMTFDAIHRTIRVCIGMVLCIVGCWAVWGRLVAGIVTLSLGGLYLLAAVTGPFAEPTDKDDDKDDKPKGQVHHGRPE